MTIEWRGQRRPVGSCVDCYAWGRLNSTRCFPCMSFKTGRARTRCRGCSRTLACHKGFCRLCWAEASRRARPGHSDPLEPILSALDCHQLFFTDMLRSLRSRAGASLRPEKPQRRLLSPPEPFTTAAGLGQYRLFEVRRDLLRFSRPPHVLWLEEAKREPHLAQAFHAADRLADAYGWSDRLLYDVHRGLIIALACRPPDELVPHSELEALAARRISVHRVAAVLGEAGLLLDDRADNIDLGWQRQLADTAPAIRHDMLDWLRRLRHGSDRSRPRAVGTATEYCRAVAPLAVNWSHEHDHFREITVVHVKRQVDLLPNAHARNQALVALRSLFRFLNQERRIFTTR